MSYWVYRLCVCRRWRHNLDNLLCLRPVGLFPEDSVCSSYRLSLVFKILRVGSSDYLNEYIYIWQIRVISSELYVSKEVFSWPFYCTEEYILKNHTIIIILLFLITLWRNPNFIDWLLINKFRTLVITEYLIMQFIFQHKLPYQVCALLFCFVQFPPVK